MLCLAVTYLTCKTDLEQSASANKSRAKGWKPVRARPGTQHLGQSLKERRLYPPLPGTAIILRILALLSSSCEPQQVLDDQCKDSGADGEAIAEQICLGQGLQQRGYGAV